MAIRLEHQPVGIAGLAAYAAGSGRRKERDRKYATDIIQNQQARADKYNLIANQQAFQVNRDQNQQAFIAGRERARNQWEFGRDQAQNKFQLERDAAQDKAMGEREAARLKEFAERDKLDFARSKSEDSRDYARSILAKPIPEGVPADMRRKLEKSRSAIGEMATSKFDLADQIG